MGATILLVLLALVSEAFCQGTPVKNFDLVLDRLEQCEDRGTGDFQTSYRVRKVDSKNKGFTLTLLGKVPIDEKVGGDFRVDRWLSGGWGRNMFLGRTNNVCEFLRKNSPGNFKEAVKVLGVKEECPLPAGEYNMTDYVPKVESPAAALPTGHYRAELNLRNATHLLGCIMLYGDVVLATSSFNMPVK